MKSKCLDQLPADFIHARQSFATRRVPRAAMCGLLAGSVRPVLGDLVLARVLRPGQHRQVELIDGRKAALHAGVLVVLAYGNRYAPDQFEALVPPDLGPCELVAGGGLAAREVARHEDMAQPTSIQPLGLLTDARGEVINLHDHAISPARAKVGAIPVNVVCGTSMNAGKTYTAAMLVRGLRARGQRVATFKATGTGSGNDLWTLHDAGADSVLDFVDAGLPSTYGVPVCRLERVFEQLLAASQATGADAVVVEIADGLGQAETAGLLRSATLRRHVTSLMFAAPDPMGAAAGERWLLREKLPLVALSGLTTAREAELAEARGLVELPVLSAEQLADGRSWVAALGARLDRTMALAA